MLIFPHLPGANLAMLVAVERTLDEALASGAGRALSLLADTICVLDLLLCLLHKALRRTERL